jgi:short-subunit dehydrogenase
MTKIRGKKVLVTGGANGIGRLLGERCLKEGAAHLVIWDINEQRLAETKKDFEQKGYQVSTYIVDVSKIEEIKTAASLTLSEVGKIDILFNNAGIVVGKFFHEHTHEEISKTIEVNVLGVMHVARAFLPDMLREKSGHIVNIASAAGLLANPKMSVYVGSKWAVLGWSESLRIEMEEEKTGVKVTTVTPSYIKTGMFEGVKPPLLAPLLEPEEIVDKIIDAVKENEILVTAPWSVHLIPILRGLMPTRVFDWIVGKGLGIYESMASFVGRPKEEAIPEKKTSKIKLDD